MSKLIHYDPANRCEVIKCNRCQYIYRIDDRNIELRGEPLTLMKHGITETSSCCPECIGEKTIAYQEEDMWNDHEN